MRVLNSFEETGFCFVSNCGEVLPSLVEFGKFGTMLNISIEQYLAKFGTFVQFRGNGYFL